MMIRLAAQVLIKMERKSWKLGGNSTIITVRLAMVGTAKVFRGVIAIPSRGGRITTDEMQSAVEHEC